MVSSAAAPFPASTGFFGAARAPRATTTAAHRMTDTESVIARAQKGEERAFHELFLAHRGTVARVVTRMLGPTHEVDDVVQDVFLHVFRSLHSFRGDAKFTTWLYRLAVNVTKMHLRRKKSRPRFADIEVPDRADDGVRTNPTPDLDVERRARIQALYRLMEGLSEKKREVLVLHDFEGVSPKEIAEIVGAPVMTVRTRLFYARKELYARLADEEALREIVDVLFESLPGKPGQPRGER